MNPESIKRRAQAIAAHAQRVGGDVLKHGAPIT